MNFRRFKFALLPVFALMMAAMASAAVKDLPIVEVKGTKYYYYEVQPQETVYSLLPRLGITRDRLLASNPTVADGLKAGMTLYFPVAEYSSSATPSQVSPASANNAAADASANVVKHKVAKGETIYGLAHTYGVSTDDLIAENPFVSDGLKVGQTLTITLRHHPAPTNAAVISSADEVAETTTDTTTPKAYIVKSKETFYSIARAHNLTVAELEDANPGISVLREGQVLSIPVAVTSQAPSAEEVAVVDTDVAPSEVPVITESATQVTPQATPDVEGSTIETALKDKAINIALVLPFMLNEETQSKATQRYTEFYKGFLMAVDSLRNNGTPIKLTAYDTQGSMAKVSEIIADPALRETQLIIAPDNAAQLTVLGDFGKTHGIKVLNIFKVRDDGYLTNPRLMQGNIPSQLMLDKAVDAMVERVRFTTPVFVTVEGGTNDKTDVTDLLKKKLDERGVKWLTINAQSKLEAADLKTLPADGSYAFIPATSRQADLNKILPAIIEWRDEVVMPSVKVIGYPEWVTFRGETLDNMHSLNTIVYSRFYNEDANPRSRRIEDKYRMWYGTKMDSAVPRQGLLGFDTGMFVINYLKNARGYYDGVQNGYSFDTTSDGPLCNLMLYLVNYRPGGVMEKTAL